VRHGDAQGPGNAVCGSNPATVRHEAGAIGCGRGRRLVADIRPAAVEAAARLRQGEVRVASVARLRKAGVV